MSEYVTCPDGTICWVTGPDDYALVQEEMRDLDVDPEDW
jgi:hypothetical protein